MMIRATMALAIAAAVAMLVAALFPTDSAYAQRNRRASPGSYGVSDPSRSASDPRFSAEDQRIIDAISRNARSAGY